MSENGLHKIPVMRTALEAIQEKHVPYVNNSGYKTCMRCGITWPCITRRLADQGLGDNLARTTKNGENND